MERDTALDSLLDLDGVQYVIGTEGYWVRFVVRRVPADIGRPHGLNYSLTLHDGDGQRLVGYDNAHPVGRGPEHDHRHGPGRVRPYAYRDAATLLSDFWADVEAVLRERGVKG